MRKSIIVVLATFVAMTFGLGTTAYASANTADVTRAGISQPAIASAGASAQALTLATYDGHGIVVSLLTDPTGGASAGKVGMWTSPPAVMAKGSDLRDDRLMRGKSTLDRSLGTLSLLTPTKPDASMKIWSPATVDTASSGIATRVGAISTDRYTALLTG